MNNSLALKDTYVAHAFLQERNIVIIRFSALFPKS